jgi:hypothetical protein
LLHIFDNRSTNRTIHLTGVDELNHGEAHNSHTHTHTRSSLSFLAKIKALLIAMA